MNEMRFEEKEDWLGAKMKYEFEPIGFIRCGIKNIEDAPNQYFHSDIEGYIDLKEKFVDGILGIENEEKILVIYVFHMEADYELIVQRRIDDRECGVFLSRSPRRPCPIGISILKVLGVSGNRIYVKNLDMIDGTPVLDIKPCIEGYE